MYPCVCGCAAHAGGIINRGVCAYVCGYVRMCVCVCVGGCAARAGGIINRRVCVYVCGYVCVWLCGARGRGHN